MGEGKREGGKDGKVCKSDLQVLGIYTERVKCASPTCRFLGFVLSGLSEQVRLASFEVLY